MAAHNDTDYDELHPSPDDSLEPSDEVFHPDKSQDRLEEDNGTPAAPARPRTNTPKLPIDHQATDTEIDTHELYDEGLTGATDYDAHTERTNPDEVSPLDPEEGFTEEDRPTR